MKSFRKKLIVFCLLISACSVLLIALTACESAGFRYAIKANQEKRYASPVPVSQPWELPVSRIENRTDGYISCPDIAEPTMNTEAYDYVAGNTFMYVSQEPLSTFSVDVDTASYANVRRMINAGHVPPAGAVRIEEMVNYFTYDYPQPQGDHPFSINAEVGPCPWNNNYRLLRLGIKGRELERGARLQSNLIFLIDVSGSMSDENKLPLVVRSMEMLVKQLDANDRVGIVVYAGNSGVALEPTSCDHKHAILSALRKLRAGGSTNGGQGIQTAYRLAKRYFIQGGVNRVILCTDGDFNVGVTNRSELVQLVKDNAKDNIYLSILSFGQGNYKDATLEQISNMGNGNHAYIDTINEAKKVLVQQATSTLVTIAKDVKIQIEFNPAMLQAYRLIGYENRVMAKEDFNDDRKDAGDVGAGHTVTALYELIPLETCRHSPDVDPLKYQRPSTYTPQATSDELLTVKLRYKLPEGDRSQGIAVTFTRHAIRSGGGRIRHDLARFT
jgi:Ca-activated chloride channel family protein